MAIKSEKPHDDDAKGVVLLVARTPAEVDEVRAALAAAGVEALLPPGAAEVLFEAGRSEVPIRIPAADYKRGLEALEHLRPDPGDAAPAVDDGPSAAAIAALAGEDEGGQPERDGPLLDEPIYEPSPAKRGPTASRVESSAGKALFISAASLVVPGIGLLAALFGIYAGFWCLRRLETPRGVTPARGAIGIGVVSVGWNLLVGYLIATRGL